MVGGRFSSEKSTLGERLASDRYELGELVVSARTRAAVRRYRRPRFHCSLGDVCLLANKRQDTRLDVATLRVGRGSTAFHPLCPFKISTCAPRKHS